MLFSFRAGGRRKTLVFGAAFVFIFSLQSYVFGLQIHNYAPERHDRFMPGTFPANPVPNPDLWTTADYSGVGWSADDRRKGFALISPRHFVGANHFRPSIGSQIVFLNRDGELKSYTYERFYTLENDDGETTDIFIGELAADIPASDRITHYPLLDKPESELVGRDIIVYGRGQDEPRIGRGTIEDFNDSFGATPFAPLNDTRNYEFEYAEMSAGPDDAYGEVGDSGSPSFIDYDGKLTVSGIHSAIEDLSSPVQTWVHTYDSFILHYKEQINDHLGATGHQLSLLPSSGDETPLSGFDAWREEHFTEAELDDSSVSGPDAAPAGDGIGNLVKYALGAPPKVPDVSILPESQIETTGSGPDKAEYLTLTYRRPDNIEDLEYAVQFSPDLQSWPEDAVLVRVDEHTDGTTSYTYRTSQPVEEIPTGFLRFNVRLK